MIPTRRLRRLLDVVGDNTPLQDAFLLADDVLRQVNQQHDRVFALRRTSRHRCRTRCVECVRRPQLCRNILRDGLRTSI